MVICGVFPCATGGAGCDNLEPGLRCPGQTDDEYVSEFSLWALAGGQLMVSTDVRNMSTLQRDVLLNTEVLAVFNDDLGRVGQVVAGGDSLLLNTGVSVWSRQLTGGCAAVALMNAGAVNATGTAAFETLTGMGWGNTTQVTVRDLWGHRNLPNAVGAFTATNIRTHATVMVKLCPVSADESMVSVLQ